MGFLVVSAVLVVTLGRLGDMFGRVKMYNLGFLVFSVFSVLLSVDPFTGGSGAMWLIVMRIGQGVGGAMLFANSTAILTDAFPAEQRGMALGINQVAAIAGSFLGLVIGGLLSEWHWRAVFWVSVPIGILGTVWGYKSLVELGERRKARIDVPGNLTFGLGLTALLVAITYGIQPYGEHSTGWTNPWVLAGMIGGIALLVAFVIVEKHVEHPMVRSPVPDPGLLDGQPGRPDGLGRPRRAAVHADHLAAGHLAAAARLQLRVHARCGRASTCCRSRRVPGGRTGLGLALRPLRRAPVRHGRAAGGGRQLHRAAGDPGRLHLLGCSR